MKKITKQDTLNAWKEMQPNQPMLKHMHAIPYKTKGSTYGACGIRIDGTPAFVDSVLSHLKELIQGEAVSTRLGLSRAVVDGSGIGKKLANKSADAEVCYIRLHARGSEGAHMAAIVEGCRERAALRLQGQD